MVKMLDKCFIIEAIVYCPEGNLYAKVRYCQKIPLPVLMSKTVNERKLKIKNKDSIFHFFRTSVVLIFMSLNIVKFINLLPENISLKISQIKQNNRRTNLAHACILFFSSTFYLLLNSVFLHRKPY